MGGGRGRPGPSAATAYSALFERLSRRVRRRGRADALCLRPRPRRPGCIRPGPQRLLQLVNAPATGDLRAFTPMEIEGCRDRAFSLLRSCGVRTPAAAEWGERPADGVRPPAFCGEGRAPDRGRAVHGRWRPPRRPGAGRKRSPGLVSPCGRHTHPGTGVPMAALSGRLAASAVMADLGSTSMFDATATRGGGAMLTRSATTGSTA